MLGQSPNSPRPLEASFRRTDESKLAPSPNNGALKAQTQYSSGVTGKAFLKQNGSVTNRRDDSPVRHRYKIIPEEVPAKELTPLNFDTNEILDHIPSVFTTYSHVVGSPSTFIYLPEDEDPYQTFIISSENEERSFVHRNNAINKMKAVNETAEEAPPGEYLSFVIRKHCEGDTESENSANNDVVDSCSNCNRTGEDAVLSFDRTITGKKEQAFSRLQDELEKARHELKLKDEEVSRLTRIREDVERELEELTASLFQEAHKMVREANEKQATAEKTLAESQMKVEVLTAEVAALKTLVLTSTPSRPNPHLHPQIGKEDSAAGVNLFNRKHRRSPSHFNLKYGRENSPPGSPVRDQRISLSESSSCSVDPREITEMDPNLQKDFLNWKETAKLDKTHPFIDRIYREDINLCLDFSNKELGEEVRKAIETRNIYVEAVTDKTKTIFPRKCALLEVTRQCHYRMKLGDQDTWYSISQMCRNRIIAVCDFLNYLRYIELGLVKSTVCGPVEEDEKDERYSVDSLETVRVSVYSKEPFRLHGDELKCQPLRLPRIAAKGDEEMMKQIWNCEIDKNVLVSKGLQLNEDGSFSKSPREESLPFVMAAEKIAEIRRRKQELAKRFSRDGIAVKGRSLMKTNPGSLGASRSSNCVREELKTGDNLTDNMKEALVRKRWEQDNPALSKVKPSEQKGVQQHCGKPREELVRNARNPKKNRSDMQLPSISRPKLSYYERYQKEIGFDPQSLNLKALKPIKDTTRSIFGDSSTDALSDISTRFPTVEEDETEESFYRKIIAGGHNGQDSTKTNMEKPKVFKSIDRAKEISLERKSAVMLPDMKECSGSLFTNRSGKKIHPLCGKTPEPIQKAVLVTKAKAYGNQANTRNIAKLQMRSRLKQAGHPGIPLIRNSYQVTEEKRPFLPSLEGQRKSQHSWELKNSISKRELFSYSPNTGTPQDFRDFSELRRIINVEGKL